MRILIVNENLNVIGGAETYLRAVIPLLLQAGHEIAVLVGNFSGSDHFINKSLPIQTWVANETSHSTLLEEISRWKPDRLYVHGLFNTTLLLTLATRYPVIFYAHNYFGTCVSGTMSHSRRGNADCTRTLGPGCLACYLPYGCGGKNPLTMLKQYRLNTTRHSIMNHFTSILVASRHMENQLRKNGFSAVRHVPLFPPSSRPDPHPPQLRAASNRVLFVGRVTQLKGLDNLIQAIPHVQSALNRSLKLVVAGDGHCQPQSQSLAQKLGVDADFLGWRTHSQIEHEMRQADLLVMPSLWPEPFGLVGIEAGCVGLPSVAFATGGIPEWLESGVSGELAVGNRRDPISLAQAMVRALQNDDHHHRLAVGAWETAKRFTPQRHLQELQQALEESTGGQMK